MCVGQRVCVCARACVCVCEEYMHVHRMCLCVGLCVFAYVGIQFVCARACEHVYWWVFNYIYEAESGIRFPKTGKWAESAFVRQSVNYCVYRPTTSTPHSIPNISIFSRQHSAKISHQTIPVEVPLYTICSYISPFFFVFFFLGWGHRVFHFVE